MDVGSSEGVGGVATTLGASESTRVPAISDLGVTVRMTADTDRVSGRAGWPLTEWRACVKVTGSVRMGEQAGVGTCIWTFKDGTWVLLAIGLEPSADSSAGALLGCVAMEATRDVRGPWERS